MKELSKSIIEKMSQKSNEDIKNFKNIDKDLIQELMRDNLETKKRLQQLEGENKQLREAFTNLSEDITEKIQNTNFKTENLQQYTNTKIDNLCIVVGDLTKAVQAIMTRINLEPITQKAKKTKSHNCDDESQ